MPDYLQPQNRGRGRPKANIRTVLDSIFFILITGCRWCDLPIGPEWAERTTAHRKLGKWKKNGTIDKIKASILGIAQLEGMIDWKAASIDGSFSPR